MKISIHQPMYIPWVPYFFKIIHSDVFVFFDDVQYPRSKNFNNRNYIKSSTGPVLLTIGIKKRSNFLNINQIEINNDLNWQKKHWKSIFLNYHKSRYFEFYKNHFEKLYLEKKWYFLADFNIALIKLISKLCNIKTKFYRSSNLNLFNNDVNQKIIKIIRFFNGSFYITGKGKGSLRFLEKKDFEQNNIILKYCSHNNYHYNQMFGNFLADCSILDLFFNYGENTKKFLLDSSSLVNF